MHMVWMEPRRRGAKRAVRTCSREDVIRAGGASVRRTGTFSAIVEWLVRLLVGPGRRSAQMLFGGGGRNGAAYVR